MAIGGSLRSQHPAHREQFRQKAARACFRFRRDCSRARRGKTGQIGEEREKILGESRRRKHLSLHQAVQYASKLNMSIKTKRLHHLRI
jgi:hypothetical protein